MKDFFFFSEKENPGLYTVGDTHAGFHLHGNRIFAAHDWKSHPLLPINLLCVPHNCHISVDCWAFAEKCSSETQDGKKRKLGNTFIINKSYGSLTLVMVNWRSNPYGISFFFYHANK